MVNSTEIRVRYGETDRMGYVHHGTYPLYFEIGRTELMREGGIVYRQLEDSGILMPVVSMQISYRSPALYDEDLIIVTALKDFKGVRLVFQYKIRKKDGTEVCEAETTLVIVDANSRKPVRPSAALYDLLVAMVLPEMP